VQQGITIDGGDGVVVIGEVQVRQLGGMLAGFSGQGCGGRGRICGRPAAATRPASAGNELSGQGGSATATWR
jgi:hypothetical protein